MKKKGMVAHLVFIMATLGLWPKKLLDGKGPFGGNVFKYPARFFVGVFVADRGISFALRAQVILLQGSLSTTSQKSSWKTDQEV